MPFSQNKNKTGRPEPTELPKKVPRSTNNGAMNSIHGNGGGGFGGGAPPKAGEDPNGMERLTGETDEQYIARQTRLRDEAKRRRAAKFGGGGGGMGGVGSGGGGGMGGSRMGGIGSDSNYNPNGGGYSGYGDSIDVSAISGSVMSGLGSAFGALSTAASTAAAAVQDENTRNQVAATAGSFWGGLSAGASNFVQSVTAPDDAGNDGLADLQRQFHSQSTAKPSQYSGFGSDSRMSSLSGAVAPAPVAAVAPNTSSMPTSTLGEAMAGPGEDPNGIERLSGESDEQYVIRQTRLRDEAKARMAAKFGGGGGGMGGVGSNSMGGVGSNHSSAGMHTPAAPSSGGFNAPMPSNMSPARPNVKVASGDDFFANFGT